MFSSADEPSAPPLTYPTVDAAQLLFIHVICQAVEDHAMPGWRSEVDAFFSGPTFASYCALLGWNHDWVRRRIQHFVARQAPAREREMPGRNTKFDSR